MHVVLDISMNFGCFYLMFVELPLLQLIHIGKAEVMGLIDLLEDEWDTLMLLRRRGRPSVDPQQQYGVKGIMLTMPAKKLQQERTIRSYHLEFQSQYKLLAIEAYLKANSADPSHHLTLFEVR